jgi:hypothetical protein
MPFELLIVICACAVKIGYSRLVSALIGGCPDVRVRICLKCGHYSRGDPIF